MESALKQFKPSQISKALPLALTLIFGFAPVALGETINFKCEVSQPSLAQPAGPALLQIQPGDLISDPKVMFGQPHYDPILQAKPEEFSTATVHSDIAASVGAEKINQFAVASTSSGNLWSSHHSDIYVTKKLLSLEQTQGNVVVVSRTNTLVHSGPQTTVQVYNCSHLQ